ncbi:MAG: carbohydrate ABC transporter permease [Candidatus Brocadiia bacterium]
MAAKPSASARPRRREHLTGYLYVGPAAVVLGLFFLYPVGYAFYVSLHRWYLTKQAFIGFDNYLYALGDEEFGRSLLVTAYYVLGTVPVSLGLALLAANLLSRPLRGRAVYRTIYFLPYVTSVVAAASVWVWIFYPANWGLANALMRGLGLAEQAWIEDPRGVLQLLGGAVGLSVPSWAGGPSLALVVIILFSVWHSVGFDTVVLLAALTAVPKEVYEAAELDGARGWQRLRHVTVPLISPTLFFLLLVSTIRAFRVFGHIYILASKDPERTTHNVTMFIFRTFYESGETGYGSAIALLLFAIILVVTLVQIRVVGRRVHY